MSHIQHLPQDIWDRIHKFVWSAPSKERNNPFETREAAEWYKDNKATADLQRDLDEQGIGDLIEDDTEEANFQAVYNGEGSITK